MNLSLTNTFSNVNCARWFFFKKNKNQPAGCCLGHKAWDTTCVHYVAGGNFATLQAWQYARNCVKYNAFRVHKNSASTNVEYSVKNMSQIAPMKGRTSCWKYFHTFESPMCRSTYIDMHIPMCNLLPGTTFLI